MSDWLCVLLCDDAYMYLLSAVVIENGYGLENARENREQDRANGLIKYSPKGHSIEICI